MAVKVVEAIGLPVVATGKVAVVTVGGGGCTVKDRAWTLLDPTESLTSTENENGPVVEGDPLRIPVEERVIPGGNVPLTWVHVYGLRPPEATS